MRFAIAAAFALIAASSVDAQTLDLSTATPIAGSWVYSQTAGGSEASFVTASALPQLTIRCTRATRRITIAKPATRAAPLLTVWTSAQTRALPASFNPATQRLSADVGAYEPLLDAIAFSRGRFGVSVSGAPALVVPAWAEPTRVIEDCRV
ncbi:MAG TPA: hypothetical protein VE221_02690 [Sphingomicrobium sp.]|nr:hypothetical protein [Sphingomicrobium sp.]